MTISKKTAKKKADILAAYQNIFRSPDGELVLKDLMEQHWFLNSTYKENENLMLLREGERNCILRILSILKMDINSIYERIDRDSEVMD